jgi:hypothetical protein
VEIQMKPRTVIQGKNIMLVSLPVVWAQNQKLTKGDKLECMIDEAGRLILWRSNEKKEIIMEEGVKNED